LGQKGKTMNETLIGTAPSTPMTNLQRRAHRNLASAEKRLITLLVMEAPVEKIVRQERTCSRLTQAWKKACS
jgi:hypothetical protein